MFLRGEGGIWGRVVEGNTQLVASCLCYIFFYSRKWERTKVLKGYLVWGDALCASFPSLFAIAESKDAWVMDYWSDPADDEVWNPLFTGPFND